MAESTSVKIETEIKFSVPTLSTFSNLKSLSTLGPFYFEPAGTKIIADHYIDTHDRQLLRAGYACRLRLAKGQIVLTLKSLTPPDGAIHRRKELETTVPSELAEQWPDNEVTRTIHAITKGAPLQPLCLLHQTRHEFKVSQADRKVLEFSLDEVAHRPDGPVDYYELEAELTGSGTESTLAQFTQLLQENWSLQPENKSKFERAFFATFGTLPDISLTGEE